MTQTNLPPPLSFVESVCCRPRMYTPTGTFEAVFCFLGGFYAGMTTHSLDVHAQGLAQQNWYGFLDWLQHQLPEISSADWQEFYHALRQLTTDDNQALADLRNRYCMYREETTHKQYESKLFRW